MLFSLALIFLCGMALSALFQRFKLPGLLGMLLAGIILGPSVLGLLDHTILSISGDLRQIALIIILARAGLSLDIGDLKRVGRPAVLLCFVPACFEIIGMVILAPHFLGISLLEAAIMGTVIGAVSPAVIVPRMLHFMERGYGTNRSIPQMVMAGASVDDVFVIVLFTAFTGLAQGGTISALGFLTIPSAILLGLAGGIVAGWLLTVLFRKIAMRDSAKVLVLLSVSFLLVTLERWLDGNLGFSGLLAIMALGVTMRRNLYDSAQKLSQKLSKLWVGAQLLLFVLVGATVNIEYATKAGGKAVLLILAVLLFRAAGVLVSLMGTALNQKERTFVVLAYLPKATVQAAIGGLPLAMGLPCGELVLTVAVVSILITAPLGAVLIDKTYPYLLHKKTE